MSKKKMTMGLIVGNRGFFPDHLANSGREEMIAVLQKAGMDVVVLSPQESKCGAVTTREDVHRCVELFKKNRDRIDGIIVTLPNFGEERAIADTLRLANLQVPVLVQATPDDAKKMTIAFRRDSFCGKMSACNNLKQYGIPYSITSLHTEAPDSPEFAKDLEWFAGVCRVVNGLKNLRIGSIGARPTAFNTVRYSEKLLESQGISVETLDLSEVLGRIARMKDTDDACAEQACGNPAVRSDQRCAERSVAEDGEAGGGGRVVDAGDRSRHQRGAVLDVDRGEPRHRALYRYEHDEQ